MAPRRRPASGRRRRRRRDAGPAAPGGVRAGPALLPQLQPGAAGRGCPGGGSGASRRWSRPAIGCAGLRLPDFVSRYGGGEFAIVLPETGLDGARRSVARMREQLGLGRRSAGCRRSSAVQRGHRHLPPSGGDPGRRPVRAGRGGAGAGQGAGRASGSAWRTELALLSLPQPLRRVQRDLILSPDLEVQVGAVVGVLAAHRPDQLAALVDGGRRA